MRAEVYIFPMRKKLPQWKVYRLKGSPAASSASSRREGSKALAKVVREATKIPFAAADALYRGEGAKLLARCRLSPLPGPPLPWGPLLKGKCLQRLGPTIAG